VFAGRYFLMSHHPRVSNKLSSLFDLYDSFGYFELSFSLSFSSIVKTVIVVLSATESIVSLGLSTFLFSKILTLVTGTLRKFSCTQYSSKSWI
jgi:hypothetical protein